MAGKEKKTKKHKLKKTNGGSNQVVSQVQKKGSNSSSGAKWAELVTLTPSFCVPTPESATPQAYLLMYCTGHSTPECVHPIRVESGSLSSSGQQVPASRGSVSKSDNRLFPTVDSHLKWNWWNQRR